MANQYPPYYYPPAPPKDRNIAMVLEILPGLFGFLGIGWIYAGNSSTGALWLIGYLITNIVCAVIDMASMGIFLCFHLPLDLVLIFLSANQLSSYTKKHPEFFGVNAPYPPQPMAQSYPYPPSQAQPTSQPISLPPFDQPVDKTSLQPDGRDNTPIPTSSNGEPRWRKIPDEEIYGDRKP